MKAIISGGGSGGHIFPAIAIANELRDKGVEILFVGAKGKMEMEKIPDAGYAIRGLTISGFQRKLILKNLLVPIKIIQSLMQAQKIINEFQPDAAIGVGGYASGPLVLMAACKKIPTLIQEQNSYPGVTNKILARCVDHICTGFDGMEKYFPKNKITVSGNPVRKDINDLEKIRDQALRFFGFDGNRKTLFVFGGSQGAGTINACVLDHLSDIPNEGIQLIWQTGKTHYAEVMKKIELLKIKISTSLVIKGFIPEMNFAYSAADVVVARAGALTLSELCLAQKAAILVPSPNVAEDHQTKNASAFVSANAAILINDKEAKEKLWLEAMQLLKNDGMRQEMIRNIRTLAKPNATQIIVEEIFKLVDNR